MKTFFLFSIIILSANIYSQTQPKIPEPERIRTYDVQHIKMDLKFDWNEKKVIGNVETRITPLSDGMTGFEVDAVAFKINNIRGNDGNDLNYDYDGEKININLGKSYSLSDTVVYSIDYSCQPQKGLYFIYPTELNPSMPNQIWTQGEAEDNRYWLPIYDYPNDKATTEMYVTVDSKFKTLSNGYLDYSRKINDTDEKSDHWVMDKPHSTYLIMLAVGEYEIIEDRFEDIPVHSYVGTYINQEEGRFSFRNTPLMMKVFNEVFQYRYPWSKYAQVVVEDFTYGGMENTTATVLNRRAIYNPEIENDYSSDNLISHELGHQWWGDVVTCKNWSEMWLNESFATYSTALWRENYFGRDEYDYYLYRNGEDAFRADTVTGRYPVWAGYGSVSANIYDKGSVIINTFRYMLGDMFFTMLGTFLKDHEYKNVETNDLLNAVNKTYNKSAGNTGKPAKDFKWMFDQWIWKAGYPEFMVNYKYDGANKQVELNVRQVQNIDILTPVFRVPLDIRIKNSVEDVIHKIEIFDEDETFRIPSATQPEFVVFDYGNVIFDKVYFDKPFDDWKNQLYQSENAIDRVTALKGLGIFLHGDKSHTAGKPPITINQAEALRIFEDILLNDKFWGVRSEAAKILESNISEMHVSNLLQRSYSSQSDSRIKREILKALGYSKSKFDYEFIIDNIKNETNNYIIADGINALSRNLPPEMVYDNVLPFMKIRSHRYVVENEIVEALDSANNTVNDERIKRTLLDIAFGIDVDARVRAKAITALKPYANDEDVKLLVKKHFGMNFILIKKAMITLLAQSKDRSLLPFLKDMDKRTTDMDLRKTFATNIKKLEEGN